MLTMSVTRGNNLLPLLVPFVWYRDYKSLRGLHSAQIHLYVCSVHVLQLKRVPHKNSSIKVIGLELP